MSIEIYCTNGLFKAYLLERRADGSVKRTGENSTANCIRLVMIANNTIDMAARLQEHYPDEAKEYIEGKPGFK